MSKLISNLLELNNIEISTHTTHKKWLKECYLHAQKSNHPTTKVGALLISGEKIILKGKNVLPEGVKERPERFEGENRHLYPNHAERDLIYAAAKIGLKTAKKTLVTPLHPCLQCANAIISSGISTVILHQQKIERTRAGWQKEMIEAAKVLNEAGVRVILYNGTVGADSFMHGKKWTA